eukprot:1143240-Pelagomonas_calceolata.AAC.2
MGFSDAGSRVGPVGCCACCVTHGVRRRRRRRMKKEWVWLDREDLKVLLRQPIITSYVHVNQACFPRAFAKCFDNHSSSNIVAFSFFAEDGMILAA